MNAKKIITKRYKVISFFFNMFLPYIKEAGEINPVKKFTQNHRHIRIYNNVKIWHKYGILAKNKILSKYDFVNSWDQKTHIKNKLFRLYPSIKLKGFVCSIDTPFSEKNYYHIYIESLPRLWNLTNSYFSNKLITLVLPFKRPKNLEKLILSIHPHIKIKYIPECFRIKCEKYIELPFLSKSPNNGDLNSGAFITNDYIQWFKTNYSSVLDAKLNLNPPTKKIYISRRDATVRKFINDEQISRLLFQKYGIETVVPGELSLKEQAEIFHQSNFIVSPHGAGLTNLLWCQKHNGALLEIFSSNKVASYEGFKLHAKKLGYAYDSIIAGGSTRNENVVIDINELCAKIERLLDCTSVS